VPAIRRAITRGGQRKYQRGGRQSRPRRFDFGMLAGEYHRSTTHRAFCSPRAVRGAAKTPTPSQYFAPAHIHFGKVHLFRIVVAAWCNVTPTRSGTSMAQSPSDEDVGRHILSIFMRHKVRACGTLRRNSFFDVRDGDFQRGLNSAIANDWIKIRPRDRYTYELTEAGFATGLRVQSEIDR
jgi:hypothetical protein